MKDDASIGKIDEPVRLEESKSSKEVSWSVIPKGSIAETPTAEVEECGYKDGDN